MFFVEKDDVKIGEYLKGIIREKYPSVRQFCIAYLKLRDGMSADTDEDEIHRLLNRFSQILKGERRIQVDDLPFVTHLLAISCEEVLSAGKLRVPISGHVTNYYIASSHDRSEWERYMKREDRLFLNCDEYGKTVIDYALEFKNYDFIKYLLDEKFIWLEDLSGWENGLSYGAGTNIKRRKPGEIDTAVPLEISSQDKLRTDIIALAIENGDFGILDSLMAREIPEMHRAAITGNYNLNFTDCRNDNLIRAISLSDEKVIDYYSQEFTIKYQQGRDNTFMYPFLGAVIKTALENRKDGSAELLIKQAIEHNKETLSELKKLIDESCVDYMKTHNLGTEDMAFVKEQVLCNFCFDPDNDLVSYYYTPAKQKYKGTVTNIIHSDAETDRPLIRKLLNELNGIYDEITTLNKEEE